MSVVCEKCEKSANPCPMCTGICLECCDIGLCPKCGGHLEGDEHELGYCCDCYSAKDRGEYSEDSEESDRGLKRSRE